MANFKKVLSLALILMMVISTMMIVPLTASAAALEGDGSKNNPFKLSSASHITAINELTTTGDWECTELYIEITKNFNISGKSLGGNGYGGDPEDFVYWRINGNGYTLSSTSQPLIKSTRGNVVIENLNIKSGNVAPYATQSAFVGYANLTEGNLTIRNCILTGTLRAQYTHNQRHVGGFLGATDGPGTATIENCVNEATVDGNGYVGGILGTAGGTGDINITNCANKGKVTGRFAGGIVGYIESNPNLTISNCYSVDTIAKTELVADFGTEPTNFGGIIGYIAKDVAMENAYSAFETLAVVQDGANLTKTACYEGAAVTATENAAAIAAITLAAHAHTYENACAANCSTEGCTVTREGAGHLVDSPCDTVCKRCGEATGSAGHQFDNACDPTCNVPGCGYVNEDADHDYDNPCDATCNVCNATRTVGEHYYDNDADATCNFCGVTREVAGGATNGGNNATGGDTDANGKTTAADEAVKDKGCGSALNSTYAVIALVAVLGFAFVAKKREEN